MQQGTYIILCSRGHIFGIVEGTELERQYAYHLDHSTYALRLSDDECPACLFEERDQKRHDQHLMEIRGCWNKDEDDNCPHDCLCKEYIPAGDPVSPVADQLVRIPPSDF